MTPNHASWATPRSSRSASARCRCRSTGRPPEEQSIRTIHAALDAGVNLIDTADAYALDDDEVGHNERLIAKALQRPLRRRDRRHQGRPHPRRAAPGSSTAAPSTSARPARRRCGARHRPDRPLPVPPPRPERPVRRVVGAFKELQDEGKVRWVGISNANVDADRGGARRSSRSSPCRTSSSLDFTSPLDQGRGRRSAASAGSRSCPGRRSAASATPDGTRATSTRSRGRRGARRLAAAGRAGLAARAQPDGDPDPRREPPGDDHRLGAARPSSSSRSDELDGITEAATP